MPEGSKSRIRRGKQPSGGNLSPMFMGERDDPGSFPEEVQDSNWHGHLVRAFLVKGAGAERLVSGQGGGHSSF